MDHIGVQDHEEDIYDNLASARYKVCLQKGDTQELEKIKKELPSNDVLDAGIFQDHEEDIYDNLASARYKVCLQKGDTQELEKIKKELPSNDVLDAGIYEKTEPKNKWSESSAKPILMPPKKVPPPVKVKPLLTNQMNRAGGEQMPQELIKAAIDLTSDAESVTFDSLTLPMEPLKHLTTERPRAQGRRPPSHPKATAAPDAKKSTPPLVAPKVTLPAIHVCEPAPVQRHQPTSERPIPPLPRSPMKAQRGAGKEERMDSIAWLKVELRHLQLSLNLLKNQHLNDMIELKGEIAEERIKWTALQVEVENLRGMISL
ncbi:SH3 domain-containing kinase-binding protein 1-like isoform X2 [Leucoraja erinacea]|uniref:SH3 domain-containing kinase-binding protein 1-like isoform X2 n=1 Tax=Leucoraja erinaceus TaxID=7782 RepID=UPI0024578C74|nr:SH3 domain-containing kinase-binding protein 1-like isoform X2 [Leucoraja erinacea]